jgi:hypothetical protein
MVHSLPYGVAYGSCKSPVIHSFLDLLASWLTYWQGLLLTLIEDPIALQTSQSTIPAGMQTVCKAAGIPLKGNAASNTVDYLNLTGQNLVPDYPKGALYP